MLHADERRTALDRVIAACRTVAQGYQDVGSMARDRDLAELFVELADERRRMAEAVSPHLHGLGPAGSAGQSQHHFLVLGKVVRRLKAAFASDQRLALVSERERAEDELAERIAEALDAPLPQETRCLLARHGLRVAKAQERLARVRAVITAQWSDARSEEPRAWTC